MLICCSNFSKTTSRVWRSRKVGECLRAGLICREQAPFHDMPPLRSLPARTLYNKRLWSIASDSPFSAKYVLRRPAKAASHFICAKLSKELGSIISCETWLLIPPPSELLQISLLERTVLLYMYINIRIWCCMMRDIRRKNENEGTARAERSFLLFTYLIRILIGAVVWQSSRRCNHCGEGMAIECASYPQFNTNNLQHTLLWSAKQVLKQWK